MSSASCGNSGSSSGGTVAMTGIGMTGGAGITSITDSSTDSSSAADSSERIAALEDEANQSNSLNQELVKELEKLQRKLDQALTHGTTKTNHQVANHQVVPDSRRQVQQNSQQQQQQQQRSTATTATTATIYTGRTNKNGSPNLRTKEGKAWALSSGNPSGNPSSSASPARFSSPSGTVAPSFFTGRTKKDGSPDLRTREGKAWASSRAFSSWMDAQTGWIVVKGQTRCVFTGPRGGQYYVRQRQRDGCNVKQYVTSGLMESRVIPAP
jgi:hypothetical protein